MKDYTYPTDTKENKLDFWGDIAGYYNVLGDPQYKSIHMTAYQQFSYKTKHAVVTYTALPVEDTSNDSSGGENGGGSGPSLSKLPANHKNNEKGKGSAETKKPLKKVKRWCSNTNCAATKALCEFLAGGGSNKCTLQTRYETAYTTDSLNYSTNLTIYDNDTLAKKINSTTGSPIEEIVDGGVTGKQLKTTTYTYTNEVQEVKVAEADLGSGTYATEFAAMPKLSLKAGSAETSTISTNNSGFWQVTPRYWTDGGKINLKNDSTLPYHFESEETAGVGVNTVNVYSNLKQTDKLYTLIHGYPNIVDVPNIPGVTGTPTYPKDQDETCVEVDDDAVCSKKQTPVIVTEIKLDDDNPQGLEEVDKSVHLVKNQETQDEIRKSKSK